MGFGIMVFGAFLLTDALSTEVLGFLFLFLGMRVASRHCTCFVVAKNAALFGIFISAVKLAWKIVDVVSPGLLTEMAANIFSSVYTAYLIVFYYVFFRSIAKIAEDTEHRSCKHSRNGYFAHSLARVLLARGLCARCARRI